MIGDPVKNIKETISVVNGPLGDGGELTRGYLVGKDNLAIIDTGTKGSLDTLFQEAVVNRNKNPKDVKYIFLTHPHPDTMAGVYRLKKIFTKAQVAINQKCEEVAKDPKNVLKVKYFKYTKKERLYFAIRKDPFDELERFKPDILFKDGDKFDLGDGKLMVINYDSHCLGHSMFFYTTERTMFVGDALSIYPSLPHSYLIDHSASYKQWFSNIEFLLKAKISILCPAHDLVQEGRHVKPYIEDVVRAFKEFESQLVMAMMERNFLTVNDLIERVHSAQGIKWYHPYNVLAPRANMTAHLDKLIDEKKVKRNDKHDPTTYTYITSKEDWY